MAQYKIPEQLDYEGVTYPGALVQPSYIEKIRDLQTHDSDVIVAGYPRSGNNWMQYAAYLVQNAHCLDDDVLDQYKGRRIFLEFSISKTFEACGVMCAMQRNTQIGHVFATHLSCKYLENQITNQACKTIFVVRNPKDTLTSYYHFYRTNTIAFGDYSGTWNDFFQLYTQRNLAFGNWNQLVTGYLDKIHLPNVLLIQYEEASNNLRNVLLRIARFLGKTLSEDELSRIQELLDIGRMRENSNTNFTDVIGKKKKVPTATLR